MQGTYTAIGKRRIGATSILRGGTLLAYRAALARRPDWNHPIAVAVVEVCGNAGYNWFDL